MKPLKKYKYGIQTNQKSIEKYALFYTDETGCDGGTLNNPQEPIFVLGGIILRDGGWN